MADSAVEVAVDRVAESAQRRFATQALPKRCFIGQSFHRVEMVAFHRPVLSYLFLGAHHVMDPSTHPTGKKLPAAQYYPVELLRSSVRHVR